MRKLLIALILSTGLMLGAEPAPWSVPDTILEVASEAGIACEWAQMVQPGPISGVDAKMFGQNPSRATLNRYFTGWMLVHPLISWKLTRPWRTIWQGATIGFEAEVNRKNASFGCHIHF